MNKKYQEILNKIIMDTQSSDFISELTIEYKTLPSSSNFIKRFLLSKNAII